MNIKNAKVVLFVLLSFLLVSPYKVFANVFISEVQLNPSGERFIELYNSGSSPVDLTNWYIQRKTSTGTSFGSLVSKTYFEGKSIGANSYFVISKGDIENSDLVFPNLTITESNIIQLKNAEQKIADVVSWGDIDNSYIGNPLPGRSIQKGSENKWFIGGPTPGKENFQLSSDNNEKVEENNSDNDGEEAETDNDVEEKKVDILKITTKINFPKIITAGIPFTFYSTTTDNRKITYNVGKFIWNFGDGTNITVKEYGPFTYIYEYPGDYIINLSYFDNSLADIPSAIDKITVKVVPADIYISGVGNSFDPYVEIENKSKYEVDLSGWVIATDSKVFTFPNGMNILKNNRIKISPKVTSFTADDLKYLIIQNPRGDIVAVYPYKNKKVILNNLNSISNRNENVGSGISKKTDSGGVIDLNNFTASASNSNINLSGKTMILIGLGLVIALGIISFVFVKKKYDIPDEIEKKINADDIRIIE